MRCRKADGPCSVRRAGSTWSCRCASSQAAALELAEALLATNRPHKVPTICRDSIAEFTKAGMRTSAIIAALNVDMEQENTLVQDTPNAACRRC